MLAELLPYAGPGGAVAVLAGAVWMLLTGRLVPTRVHERELADRDRQIETWRAAHAREVERGEVLSQQVGKLLAQGETTLAIVSALPRVKDAA